MKGSRLILFGIAMCMAIFGPLVWTILDRQACTGPQCTCAGKRLFMGKVYAYECECCEASACKPDADMNLDPKKKGARP